MQRTITGVLVAIFLVSSNVAGAADKVKLPKSVALVYSTGQTLEPFYFALTHGLIRSLDRQVTQGPGNPSGVAGAANTNGGVLFVAFVRYVGDEGFRQQLRPLVPIAFLGEGFNLFGQDGESALGWWGVFAPPGTPKAFVDYYEGVMGSQKLQKYLAGTVKKLGGYYKVDLLPAPELTKPATAATLTAMLNAPPRVPTPAGLAAAKSRAAQLKKGTDQAKARRDDPNGFLMIRAVGGPRSTGGVGAALLGGLVSGMPYTMQSLSGTDPGLAAALAPALSSLIQAMQQSPVPGNAGVGYLQQFQSALSGGGTPANALLQTLQANAPPAPDGLLMSLLSDIRGAGAEPLLPMNRLAMAISELTGVENGTAEQLLEMLVNAAGQGAGIETPTR